MSETRPKVLVTMPLSHAARQIVEEACEAVYLQIRGTIPPDVLVREFAGADGLLEAGVKVDGSVMDQAPRLRAISNFGVGYDTVDVDAATERGILVGNTPGVLSETTADLAFALLMAAGRRLGECDRFMRSRNWSATNRGTFMALDIHHATLGILGVGRIGIEIAKRAVGFSMRILYHDVVRSEEAERKYGATFVDKETLLRESDYVTLHTPLMLETRHLIGAPELEQMKATAVLINASRGGCVDQKALYQALSTGRIRAAGLDVYEDEPISADDPLLTLENCFLAPHVGSATQETREKMAVLAAQNLVAGVRGLPLPAAVNPEAAGRGRQAQR